MYSLVRYEYDENNIKNSKILNINGLDCFYQLEELIIEINPSIHHISFESETLKKIIISINTLIFIITWYNNHFINFFLIHARISTIFTAEKV